MDGWLARDVTFRHEAKVAILVGIEDYLLRVNSKSVLIVKGAVNFLVFQHTTDCCSPRSKIEGIVFEEAGKHEPKSSRVFWALLVR